MRNSTFTTWFDTFIEEKGIDLEQTFSVEGPSGENIMPVGTVIEAIKMAPADEQGFIKHTLVRIDFHNGDPVHFFQHLAHALAI